MLTCGFGLQIGHAVVSLRARSIWDVSRTQLKIQADKIQADWDNRQIPRFRDNPPGPSCSSAVQELCRVSQSSDLSSLDVVQPLQDWKWTNMDLVARINELSVLRARLASAGCTSCSQFQQHVSSFFSSWS